MADSLSDFELMKQERLPNWGRWGRDPGRRIVTSTVYDQGKRDNNPGVDEDGEYTETHDEAPRIDVVDAEFLDSHIMRLPRERRNTIRSAFYQHANVAGAALNEAIRALLDRIDASWGRRA